MANNENNKALEKLQQLHGALSFLAPVGDLVVMVGGILRHFGEAGFRTWERWCNKNAAYAGEAALRDQWGLIPVRGVQGDFDELLVLARQAGWWGEASAGVATWYTDTQTSLPPQFSEERLAAEYTLRFGEDWRYVAEWSRWYRWDGARWVSDNTLHAFDLARRIAREASARAMGDPDLKSAEQLRVATTIASAKTVAAIARLARSDRVHALSAADWDQDPWLLNTPAGIVDLGSGQQRSHERRFYMTRITGAAAAAGCDTWRAFLRRVTGEDAALEAFLQRFVGYCLTGVTREHAMLFVYGLGGNGKTTFLSTIQGMLGDYATSAPMETFVETHGERHPTDLAMLRGARLVVAQEVEDGQRWAVSRLKLLTGGDTVRARFMRADYFEYTPQFKLILAGNHKPSFRQVDEAIRRRFFLVPFTQTIPAAERDAQLVEKLRGEWPGILAWAIEGCRQWQAIGLEPPAIVLDATHAYLEDEDLLRTWLSEACELERGAFAAVAELHASYMAWATRAGERFLGLKRFSQGLEDHGLRRERSNGNRYGSRPRGFSGVRLRDPGQQPRLVE